MGNPGLTSSYTADPRRRRARGHVMGYRVRRGFLAPPPPPPAPAVAAVEGQKCAIGREGCLDDAGRAEARYDVFYEILRVFRTGWRKRTERNELLRRSEGREWMAYLIMR